MNENCGWEEVYKINGVSPEYNRPIDEFDLLMEEIEAKLTNTGSKRIDLTIQKREAISAL